MTVSNTEKLFIKGEQWKPQKHTEDRGACNRAGLEKRIPWQHLVISTLGFLNILVDSVLLKRQTLSVSIGTDIF